MGSFWQRVGVDSPFDPTCRFETSYLVKPYVLAGVRLLFSFYAFFTLIYRLAYKPATADQSFSYFTNISYWSIAFYFLFAGFHTFMVARTGYAPLQKWPKILQFFHSLLYTTIIVFPFLVTIVYWLLLAPDHWYPTVYEAWSNISVHALNSLFALLEIILPRTVPMPWLHLPFLILFMAGYLAVAYITYATQGFYTYSFLNPSTHGSGSVAAYSFGIAAGTIIVFSLTWGVLWVKIWLFEKVLGRRRDLYEGGMMLEDKRGSQVA